MTALLEGALTAAKIRRITQAADNPTTTRIGKTSASKPGGFGMPPGNGSWKSCAKLSTVMVPVTESARRELSGGEQGTKGS